MECSNFVEVAGATVVCVLLFARLNFCEAGVQVCLPVILFPLCSHGAGGNCHWSLQVPNFASSFRV